MTLAITAKAKKMRTEGKNVINFAAGEPDFDTPHNIKSAAISAISEGFTKYTPASGMPQLKDAICDKLKKDNALSYKPSQIIVSCGAKHSLYNIFQALCDKGDEVIVPSPYWVSYPEMVKLSGAKPVVVKTDEKSGFKLTEKDLKKAATKRTKAIIINSPSNPTGSAYSIEDLSMVAKWAISKNIFVISDEIYENLIYDGLKHISIASLGNEIFKLAIVVNGVSKSYSMTGWRIGYLAGDEKIVGAINKLQSHSTSNPASISQKAALEALTGGNEFVRKIAEEFEKRRDLILGGIGRINKLSCFKPQGAFYLFCDISKTKMDSISFANKLLEETRVAVIPGIAFGWDTHVRMSFACKAEDIKEGINRISKWLEKQ